MRDHPRVAVVCGGDSAEAEVSRSSGTKVAAALGATFTDVALLELDQNVGAELGGAGAEVVFRAAGLPVAPEVVVDRREGIETAAERIVARLGPHVVVKPRDQGSAIGVRFASDDRQLVAALEGSFDDADRVLVERRVDGREVTVGVLERGEPVAFPPIEVTTPDGAWYDYEHRYTAGLSEHLIPARLPTAVNDELQRLAIAAHRALGCRDLSRADFVVPEGGEAVLLEVNTLPGLTGTSLYPDGARAIGIEFPDLVAELALRAHGRGPHDAGGS